MPNYRLLRSHLYRTIGITGSALVGFAVIGASAKPEQQQSPSVAQVGESSEPPPARSRPRKPAPLPNPKAPAQAASKSDSPSTITSPVPTVAPAASAAAPDASVAVTEPVRHARDAKLARCAEMVTTASSRTIDTAHAAVSTWSQKGPDDHMFQSIVTLSYSNAIAPKAATVLVAAPEGASCEATTVQIYPTTRACSEVETDLKKSGRTLVDFGGVPMTQEGGLRVTSCYQHLARVALSSPSALR